MGGGKRKGQAAGRGRGEREGRWRRPHWGPTGPLPGRLQAHPCRGRTRRPGSFQDKTGDTVDIEFTVKAAQGSPMA